MSSMENLPAKSSVNYWQTTLETVGERNKFMFENSLLSDIKFVVNPLSLSREKSDDHPTILPAHKYVLATGSPVFCAMFYGDLAEPGDTIDLPDCDHEGFREFLRYLYCDEVKLTGFNIIQVLYLAKKYIVPSLAKKCTEFLSDNLEVSNVLQILPDAEKYQEESLVAKCWCLIDENANELVKSETFQSIDQTLLESVLERSTFNAAETSVFNAVMMWAANHEVVQHVNLKIGNRKRAVLGEKVVKLIRFPVIAQDFFRSVVVPTELLHKEEIEQVTQYYLTGSVEGLTFCSQPRRSGRVLRCKRFANFKYCAGWWYAKINEAVVFSVDQRVLLYGVRLYGDKEGASYLVSIRLYERLNSSDNLFTNQAVYENDNVDSSTSGFDVNFERPIPLMSNIDYVISCVIDGPPYYYGTGGQSTVNCNGVKFSFTQLRQNSLTSAEKGQYPEFIFKKDS